MDGLSLYALTRTLVGRGCPEHPRYRHDDALGWFAETGNGLFHLADDDALAVWTMWALEWLMQSCPHMVVAYDEAGWAIDKLVSTYDEPSDLITEYSPVTAGRVRTAFKAIEVATRHLESHDRQG